MKSVSITRAKAHFSRLVERAASGEVVLITRRRKPIAQISALRPPHKQIDIAALRALTDSMPMQPESAGKFVRRIRNEDRY